jgi:hypothetical protein
MVLAYKTVQEEMFLKVLVIPLNLLSGQQIINSYHTYIGRVYTFISVNLGSQLH